jgi:aspartate-semialdehyde dehydrogenase
MEHRVAISHASGIAAEAILEKLPESGIEPDSLFLLDHETQVGKRLPYAGGRLVIADQYGFDYSQCSLLLMPEFDAEVEAAAVAQGCLLLSHSIERDGPPVFMAEAAMTADIGYSEARLRLAGAELCCLLPALLALDDLQSIAQLGITLMRSAEFRGKPGIDELASQTIDLLNTREVSPSVFPGQIAFNILPEAADSRIMSDLGQFLGTILYPPMVQTLNVPVFHGFASSVQLRFESDIDLVDCRKRLESLDKLSVKQGLASPISDCNQSFSCVISHLEQAPNQPCGLQFWMIADPMRYGLANNYVNVAEFLLKSFL